MLYNLNPILHDAQQKKYGAGFFNATDSDMLEAVICAAEELQAPLIIGTAEVLLPYGALKLIAPSMVAAAKRASIPVAVHYDHGLTFEKCVEALQLGFTSVMFDGSAGTMEENIAQTCEIVKVAHAMDATVEGEIGHVGEAVNNDNSVQDLYTTPEEAETFVRKTGVDALAIAIGTAHGAYKTKPRLDIGRLKAIRQRIQTPLVLHGGSGLSDEDFKNVVQNGISKINIFTDLLTAGTEAITECIRQNVPYLEMRNAKVAAIQEAAKKKLMLFAADHAAF